MNITYLISAYNRPDHLACCLYSLKIQTDRDFEAIVVDNSTHSQAIARNREAVHNLLDHRFHYRHVGTPGAYHAIEAAIPLATGDYLCFPSDDSYYVPTFAHALLTAARSTTPPNPPYDLVYSDMLYDERMFGDRYDVLTVYPRLGSIDKTGFILARHKFQPFPDKGPNSCSDGYLIDKLIREGITHTKVPGVFVVHS